MGFRIRRNEILANRISETRSPNYSRTYAPLSFETN